MTRILISISSLSPAAFSSITQLLSCRLAVAAAVSVMEHGSHQDPSQSTFSLTDEDHTLAISVRCILNQDPRVAFCGYSIPHPSDARVNIRVQTTGELASEVMKDSCQDLMLVCQHVRSTFDQAVMEFRRKQGIESMNITP